MSELQFADPCVIFALGREARDFRREFRPHLAFPGGPCIAHFCGPAWLSVLVVETGVGSARMAASLEWLLRAPRLGGVPYRPKVVVSAGYSGALREDSQIGDVLLATDIADLAGNVWPTTWPGALPAEKWCPALHRGRLLTVAGLIATAEEKRRLGQKYQAAAVDMETAVVARLCSEHGVPFGCVRAISDNLDIDLSHQLVELVFEGRVAPGRLLAALARRPRLASQLWRLARHTRLASRNLGKALGELLTLTLPWSDEL